MGIFDRLSTYRKDADKPAVARRATGNEHVATASYNNSEPQGASMLEKVTDVAVNAAAADSSAKIHGDGSPVPEIASSLMENATSGLLTPTGVPLEVINQVAGIPDGLVVSASGGAIELPEERRLDFVLIHAANNFVNILVSPESHGKAMMFDVRQRVHKAGYQSVLLCASRDIIKIAYERLKPSVLTVEAGSTDIERLISRIVEDAYRNKTSDIHIETRGEQADILFRVNGIRTFHANITRETAQAIGSVLYSVYADSGSKDVTWNSQDVADGAIEWTLQSGKHLQLRFSSAPIYPSGNFHIVIRVLSMESTIMKMADLGYNSTQLDMLDLMSTGSQGIVLICGPTNSGKSTTLQSVIGRVFEKRGKEIKIITVEDPVEYVIPGACQIPVARRRNSAGVATTDFNKYLRGALRQDPDVVLVGEIRDEDSVMVTRDLILAGRKVFATIHTNSALWAFMRLREIGLPWEILTMPGFIAGIVYQRLLPQLCEHCAVSADEAPGGVPDDLMHRLQYVVDFSVDKIRFRGRGCKHCNNTGVSGRTSVAEMVLPDRTLLRLLSAERFLDAEAYWRNGSGVQIRSGTKKPITVIENAIEKMKMGLISPVDIENQIGVITSDFNQDDVLVADVEPKATARSGLL